ncbi:hypothetical protein BC941DRAFT_407114 [Chlamydoabsidia padenii]|nr:hypothetical protein BC941DRAFT_407114 [Chlamydoabsidia padenii]
MPESPTNKLLSKDDDTNTPIPIKPLLKHQPISSANTIRSEMSIESIPPMDILESREYDQDHQGLIRSAFALSRNETVVGEYPCYLVRLVTLPGWMYLTDERICFFAPLPGKEEAPRKTGYLTKKNHRTSPLSSRYHFILQYHVISWYESAESHYQPLGSIELKNVVDIRDSNSRRLGFKIITPTGKHTFIADSEVSKKEWMDDLRRAMFMAKNDGNCVRIVLPFTKTTNVSKDSAFDFAEYIKVSISDSQQPQQQLQDNGNKSLEGDDDYYFAFFTDIDEAFKVIHGLWQKLHSKGHSSDDGDNNLSIPAITADNVTTASNSDDTNGMAQIDAATPITEVSNLAAIGEPENNNNRLAASNYLMDAFIEEACSPGHLGYNGKDVFDSGFKDSPTIHLPEQDSATHDGSALFGKSTKGFSNDSNYISHTTDTDSSTSDSTAPTTDITDTTNTSTNDLAVGNVTKRGRSGSLKAIRHYATLPFHQLASKDYLSGTKRRSGSTTLHDISPSSPNQMTNNNNNNASTSLITTTRKHLSLPATSHLLQLASPLIINRHKGMDQHQQQHGQKRKDDLSSAPMWLCTDLRRQLCVLSPSVEEIEWDDDVHNHYQVAVNDEVQKNFPMLGSDVTVTAVYRASVWRMIPYYGRLYFTKDYACFHANVLAGHQKIVIPFDDIVSIRPLKSRGYHLLHGIGVTTKDMTEEIFFEFVSLELRDSCYALLTLESHKHLEGQFDSSESDSNKDEPRSPRTHQFEDMTEKSAEHVVPPSEYNGPPLLSNLPDQQRNTSRKTTKPLTITCLTIGSRGDVQPYIALCKQLQQEGGHHCRIASHEEYKPWVEKHGIEFRSIGGDPGELMKLCIDNNFLSFSFIKNGYKFFYTWFDTLLETSWDACQGTDVLIESPSAMVGIHLAEKLEIPYFRSMPFPWTRTTRFPHPFATPNHTGSRVYNDMTYMMIEMALWAGISRPINRFRREKLNLPTTTLERLELWRVPYLYSFSPLVQPNPKDWPDYIHCTGYWFLDEKTNDTKDSWQPSPELVAFLGLDNEHSDSKKDTRPIVYIGFGSIMVSDPEAMSRVIVESVIEANVRAIVCKGWSSRKASSQQQEQQKKSTSASTQVLQDYPDSILRLDSVPHDWLFPLIQGVVHHGGAGTCAAGLRAGLPTVIKPFFGDQRFWAHRVTELGVGVCMPKLTKEHLKENLLTITQDKAMINKAKLLGEAIRQENGTQTAMECLYRNLGLAKRTKQLPASSSSAVSPTNGSDKEDLMISPDNSSNNNRLSLSSYASKLKHLPLFGTDNTSD